MAQIWLFVAGVVGMTVGTLTALIPTPHTQGARARIGLAVTALGLAIGVAGAFVG